MTERFSGFSKSGLVFLTELAATQNREWFEANRATYERELRLPMQALVAALAFPFQVHDIELACDPKRALFRIYRDIRFSKNKDPYKTHVGASMTKSGERLAPVSSISTSTRRAHSLPAAPICRSRRCCSGCAGASRIVTRCF